MNRLAVAIAVVLAYRSAWGDVAAEQGDSEAFQAATRLAGDSSTIRAAIDAFEAIGNARPITKWTDNAWSEAGRLAERNGELERARRDYEQTLAVTDDAMLRRRAKAALDRLGEGRWDAVTREHAKWVAESLRGDPQAALAELERLARANPDYPRRADLWLAIARGWELEGEAGRALELLRPHADSKADRVDAPSTEPGKAALGRSDRSRVGFAFVRIAIRYGALDDAEAMLDELAARGGDRAVIAKLRDRLETAARRAWIRRGLWLVVVLLGVFAAIVLRRETGSWRSAGRRLLQPPSEVVFLLPIGGVLVAVALTGNPVVARALLGITAAGLIAAWVSGVMFEAHRVRTGRIAARRAIVQAVLVLAAVASFSYLAIDRDRLLDLVEETVEHGPTAR